MGIENSTIKSGAVVAAVTVQTDTVQTDTAQTDTANTGTPKLGTPKMGTSASESAVVGASETGRAKASAGESGAVSAIERGVIAVDGSTKARIERAALTLFVERGVDGVAVREIAARVGITDAAIYRHFKSKSELAESLMLAIHERLTDLVRGIEAQDVSFRDKITNLVNAYCALADEDWDLFSYHLLHLHYFPDLFAGDSSKRTRRAGPISACADMLDAAVEAGEIAPGNIALLASMVLGIVLQAASAKAHMRLRGPLSIYAPEFDKAVWAVLRHR